MFYPPSIVSRGKVLGVCFLNQILHQPRVSVIMKLYSLMPFRTRGGITKMALPCPEQHFVPPFYAQSSSAYKLSKKAFQKRGFYG